MISSLNTPSISLIGQNKDTKIERLSQYVYENKYIDIAKWQSVCQHFDLPIIPSIFRKIYRERFYHFLRTETTTVATIEKVTGIPHKYLTECKAFYENKGLLKVVAFGICPTTKSKNVQFVSTNPNTWSSFKFDHNKQQLKLWEGDHE